MRRDEDGVGPVTVEERQMELRGHLATKREGGGIRGDQLTATTTTHAEAMIVIHLDADRNLSRSRIDRSRIGCMCFRVVRLLTRLCVCLDSPLLYAMIRLCECENDVTRHVQHERVLGTVNYTVVIRTTAGTQTKTRQTNKQTKGHRKD